MSKGSRKKLAKITDKYQFKGLDTFCKVVEDFKIIPNEEFETIEIFAFNGKKINAKRINNELTLNLKQLSKYIEANYNTIRKVFERNEFQEGKHYFKGGGQNVAPKNMTLLGVLKLLRYTRAGYAEAFYDEMCEYIYYNMKPKTVIEFKEETKKLLPEFTEEMKWRIAILKRDKFICQCCGKHANSAHHIYSKYYLKENNMDLWDINNGASLCHDCHIKITEDGRKWFIK